MSDSKSKLWVYVITLVFFVGFVSGIITYAFMRPVKEVEISPEPGANVLDFYVNYLKAHGYNVTIQELAVNDYREVKDFKEFLWLLEYCNFTECYVDYGCDERVFLFGESCYRVPKLWFQFDGVYWELRCE